MTAYRGAFGDRRAQVGPQDRTVGDSRVWVLPNPSGLNAHVQLPALGAAFREVAEAAGVELAVQDVQDV